MTTEEPTARFGEKLKRAFATNSDWSENGKWFDHESGIRVKIARSQRDAYQAALRKAFRPYRDLPGQTPAPIERKVRIIAASKTLVTDWDMGEGGLPCTEENVVEAMTAYPDFYLWVFANADAFENFKLYRDEEDAGNS